MNKILVYGFYGKGNTGDDLFVESFRRLFPHFDFVFTEFITSDKLDGIDAIFFGGGSFLYDRPVITDAALKILKEKKVFYLGVGVESEIHPIHKDLMISAQMIATRSLEQVGRLKLINKNSSYIPDLVFALQDKVKISNKVSKSVLIMPNISVVPKHSDPHWKHAAWGYFKSEFCQFLDWLVEQGYQPTLFSMCQAAELDDDWAANELVGHMKKRNNRFLLTERPSSIEDITGLVSRHELVITQRFHGIVLSEMTRTPYVAIHHHDKLKFSQPGQGTFLSYYNSSKHSFISSLENSLKMNFTLSLTAESAIFKAFSIEVASLI